MTLEDYSALVEIGTDARSAVNLGAILNQDVSAKLENDRFVVVNGVLEPSAIDQMRAGWLERGNRTTRSDPGLSIGEENYTHRFFGRYTRHFEFYWNPPTCALSRDVSLLLHYARNVNSQYHPLYGLQFSPKRMGIYLAVTHYALGSGEMAVHVDPNSFLSIHFVVPLTFKGQDYASGGLVLHSAGDIVDVDALLRPGSVLFFDGGLPHGVDRIEGAGKRCSVGRLQMFSIPTVFGGFHRKSPARSIAFELYGRLRYLGYRYGIGRRADNKNFR